MNPGELLSHLGQAKIESILEELNSGQMKSVLRTAGKSVKVPSGCVLQKARRKIWSRRIEEGLQSDDGQVASELLYQWLLHHRRSMLVDYLNALGVEHVRGETEDSFTKTLPRERLVGEALKLMERHDAQEVACYVLFLDHHQESDVFAGSQEIMEALRGSGS